MIRSLFLRKIFDVHFVRFHSFSFRNHNKKIQTFVNRANSNNERMMLSRWHFRERVFFRGVSIAPLFLRRRGRLRAVMNAPHLLLINDACFLLAYCLMKICKLHICFSVKTTARWHGEQTHSFVSFERMASFCFSCSLSLSKLFVLFYKTVHQ